MQTWRCTPTTTSYTNEGQIYAKWKIVWRRKDNVLWHGTLYKDNNLLANPDKFQALTVNPRNLNTSCWSPDIHIDDKAIKITDHMH